MKPHRKNDRRLDRSARTAEGPEKVPERQCIATRERLPQAAMLRFACGPDGQVVPDVAGKLPGRGVWVKADRASLDKAVRDKAFARGFKASVTVPDGLGDRVEALLLARCQGLLGMARKGGQVVAGFDQVRAAIRSAPPAWIIAASDSAADGRNKVHFLAEALYDEVETAGALSSQELGMAFGRPGVVHALLKEGSLAAQWAIAYRRLAGFRPTPEQDWFSGRDR